MPDPSRWLAPYPHPVAAVEELVARIGDVPVPCRVEPIGHSSQGRALFAFHLGGEAMAAKPCARLLVTAQIHAGEFIGGYVARALLRALAREYGKDARVTQLLRRAEVSIVPLLNPDGAQRVWDRAGWTSFRGSRVTARGVDPNRNFPSVPIAGARAWNSSSRRTWSPYYSGPYPLSEPECLALARLCKRQRYCAAIHFHSFGGVVFFPATGHPAAKQMFDVFRSVFPPAQRYLRYRPVPEPMSTLTGQLDLFLLQAFGTPSVTVEVSRPSWHLALQPLRWLHFFSWANPPNPQWWADNDVPAAIQALEALLDRSGGQPLLPEHPELGEQVP